MTKTLDKTELVRLAWLTELRRQGQRQCVGEYMDGLGSVCALGLLAEVSGMPRDELWTRTNDLDLDDLAEIGALAGLSDEQTDGVYGRNDGSDGYQKHTFAEIADVVEGWFK